MTALLALFLTLFAAANFVVALDYDASQMLSFINGNYSLWKSESDSSYEFVFSWSCFCSECYISEKLIEVLHSSISKVKYNNDEDDDSCSGSYLEETEYKTVDDLFIVLKNYSLTVDEMTVSFHEQLGYPTQAWIDPESMLADEEFGWTIDCLSVYSRTDIYDECSFAEDDAAFVWDYVGWGLLGLAFVACLIIAACWQRMIKHRQPQSVELADQSNSGKKAKYEKMEEEHHDQEFNLDDSIDHQ